MAVFPCAGFFLWTGAGEIPVSGSDPDAVPPSSGTIPSWRASWNPTSTILYVPGETLGPVWSGQQHCVDGAFLLEGAAWYGALRGAWSVEGQRRRAQRWRVIIVLSFRHCLDSFSFVHVVLLLQYFLCIKLVYWCGCYINIAERKSVSRDHMGGEPHAHGSDL